MGDVGAATVAIDVAVYEQVVLMTAKVVLSVEASRAAGFTSVV